MNAFPQDDDRVKKTCGFGRRMHFTASLFFTGFCLLLVSCSRRAVLGGLAGTNKGDFWRFERRASWGKERLKPALVVGIHHLLACLPACLPACLYVSNIMHSRDKVDFASVSSTCHISDDLGLVATSLSAVYQVSCAFSHRHCQDGWLEQ